MIYTIKSAKERKVDDSLQIIDLFTKEEGNFDLVIASIDGNHPFTLNRISQRAYFILEGHALVDVDGKEYDMKKNDFVFIDKGQPHSIRGKAKYLIITSPPYHSLNEEAL